MNSIASHFPVFLMRSVAIVFAFVLLGAVDPLDTAVSAEDGFVSLFNGTDLTGWQRVNTDERTWSVTDGMLVCSGKPIGELRTKRMYQNFIMEVEWRHMKPRGNAGIFIWADDITARGVPFHRGIEVQVLENAYGNNKSHTTHGDIFPIHGAKMIPINGNGGSRAFPTEWRSRPSPQWNHYRIEAVDGNVSLAVNGKLVTQGRECNPRKGYICIESEGGIVHYRNLKLKELPDSPLEASLVAIADRGYRCLYTGIDLSLWETDSAAWRANDWRLVCKTPDEQPVSISTQERFEEFGFVVDVRLTKESKVASIDLGTGPLQIEIDDSDPTWQTALEPRGRWNRIAGTVGKDRFTVVANGKPVLQDVPIDVSRTSSPFKLRAAGTVEFANIYVRDLSLAR